jgi:hypothetical protein
VKEAEAPDEAGRRRVEALAGYGVHEADIATVLAMEPGTLRRLYRAELASGHIKANSRVAENLYRKAMGDGREASPADISILIYGGHPVQQRRVASHQP